MNYVRNIFNLEMNKPEAYSWFHILFTILVIVTTFLICHFFKDAEKKVFKRIFFIFWIIIVVLEIYKQLIYSYDFDTKTWAYQWYAFPFQICSSILYVGLIFLLYKKDDKFMDALMAYLAFYSMFAGTCVYIYPRTIFVETIGINIQTMVHHGTQIIMGVYIAVWNRKKIDIHFFLKSIIIFLGLVVIADLLNIIIPHITSEEFNMFFISPYYDSKNPVFTFFYNETPYIVFLMVYLILFTIGAFLVYLLDKTVITIINNHKNKKLLDQSEV